MEGGERGILAEHSNLPSFIWMEPQNLLSSNNCYPGCSSFPVSSSRDFNLKKYRIMSAYMTQRNYSAHKK